MRRGNISSYEIYESPEGIPHYRIFKIGTKKGKIKAPTGAVERARIYMSYYGEEDFIWNFSDDIKNNWDAISS